MREDLAFIERVHRDLGDVRWPEPQEIRAVARRRSRRRVVLAAVVVLAMATGTAYASAGRPPVPPTDTAGPAETAGRTEIPPYSLLSSAEVPVPTGVQLGDAGLGELVRLDPLLERCGGEQNLPAVDAASRYSRSLTLLSRTDGRSPVRTVLSQDVYRLDPRVGGRLFGSLRMLLDACREWRLVGSTVVAGEPTPSETLHRWETPASDFAGDESMLVRHVSLAPRGRPDGRELVPAELVEVTVVVRVGDLVTVLVPGPDAVADRVDGTGFSYADLEALGRTAAYRMCVAANPPC
ncbi:hypothetical protein [Micromonospora sp. NPDC049301]|uniref:hypothetical protein n=1 Tax=Micromonospora sp. NPDC049301 TaxID=3155723 RepID=UPI00343D7E6C